MNPCDDHLFDGSHETQNYDGVLLALPALNWQKCVTVGAAHCALHLDVQHSIEVRTAADGALPGVGSSRTIGTRILSACWKSDLISRFLPLF